MAEDLDLDLTVFNNTFIVQNWKKGITEIRNTMRGKKNNIACTFMEPTFKINFLMNIKPHS